MSYPYLEHLSQFQAGRKPSEVALELRVTTLDYYLDPAALPDSAIRIIADRIGVPFDTLRSERDNHRQCEDETLAALPTSDGQRMVLPRVTSPEAARHREITHRLSAIETALDLALKVAGRDCNDASLLAQIEFARARLRGEQVPPQAPATAPDKPPQG
jgi:hypothetical protein